MIEDPNFRGPRSAIGGCIRAIPSPQSLVEHNQDKEASRKLHLSYMDRRSVRFQVPLRSVLIEAQVRTLDREFLGG